MFLNVHLLEAVPAAATFHTPERLLQRGIDKNEVLRQRKRSVQTGYKIEIGHGTLICKRRKKVTVADNLRSFGEKGADALLGAMEVFVTIGGEEQCQRLRLSVLRSVEQIANQSAGGKTGGFAGELRRTGAR